MTPERWAKIEEVFNAVSEMRGDARSAYLDDACRDDADLRTQVEQLLEADKGLGTDFHEAIRTAATGASQSAITSKRFGNWQVTGVIGKGGMGSVYRAVRSEGQFKQEAAVKVLRRGMDSEFALARFRQERQILASLNHPNIARLIDGGQQDGEPYIVLELVTGIPITQYCREHTLSINSILNLFIQSASAVQYAHQRFVIHRDLKPANILVTDDGTTKLLDFGIAKLSDPDYHSETLAQTSTGMKMMTPDYASPEQVMDQHVTAASDVYCLGAILYELLTGQKAHRIEKYDPLEIAHIVCETAPLRPGSLRRELSGDLEVIIMKSLAKEPERRYASAQEFIDDIQRFLDNEPVKARPDTTWYRTRKYIRRHWVGLLAASITATGLCTGAGVAIYQARVARAQFNDVRQLANKFLFDFHDAIANTPGTVKAREMMVSTALEYLNKLSASAASDPGLQWELAVAYSKVADAQGSSVKPSLQQPLKAVDSYAKAFELARPLWRKGLLNEEQRGLYMVMLCEGGGTQVSLGNMETALKWDREAVEVSAKLQPRYQRKALGELADALGRSGDLPGSVKIREQIIAPAREAVRLNPSHDTKLSLAATIVNLGYYQARLTMFEKALKNEQEGLAMLRALHKEKPDAARTTRNLINALNYLGLVYAAGDRPSLMDFKEASRYYDEALSLTSEMTKADSSDKGTQSGAALIYVQLACTTRFTHPEKALQYGTDALRILSATPSGLDLSRKLARIFMADAAVKLKQFPRAEALLKETEKLPTGTQGTPTGELAGAWARLHFARGDKDSAARYTQQALAGEEEQYKEAATPAHAFMLANALEQASANFPETAHTNRQRAVAVWEDQVKRYPGLPYLEKSLTEARARLQK